MLAGYSHPHHHTTACYNQRNQTAGALSLGWRAASEVDLILPYPPTFLDYRKEQVPSCLRALHTQCFGVEPGPGSHSGDRCIIVREESGVDACQYFPGSSVLVRTYGSVFPSCVFPCSVLVALPYLPALGGLLSPESNSLCSLLCVPIKMTLFRSQGLIISQERAGDCLRVE